MNIFRNEGKTRKKNGITLISLIITIIVILILAGVSTATLIGDNGIIIKAQEATFREEMSEIRDKMDLYNIKNEMNQNSQISLVQVPKEDLEEWIETLRIEINASELTIVEGNVKDVYYIEENGESSKKYIYNKETDIIYKVKQTILGSYEVHSVEKLNYLQSEVEEL